LSEIQRALRFFDRPARDAMGINHCGPDGKIVNYFIILTHV
jgi:hypothetical protein